MANTSIWWIRRDLRLTDNQALSAALRNSQETIPLFIIDPFLVNSERVAEKRLDFLYGGLESLDLSLKQRGSRLVLRKGSPEIVLKEIFDEVGARKIFAQGDYSPYARQRDTKVKKFLPLELIGSSGLTHPGDVLKKDGSPYTVFTPYKKKWLAEMLPLSKGFIDAPENIPTPKSINSKNPLLRSHPKRDNSFKPGELEARLRLERFMHSEGIFEYNSQRDRMDVPGTSLLSPYFRFGMLSPRMAFQKAAEILDTADVKENIQGAETWMSELIWREFYLSILFHFPEVMKYSFRAGMRGIRWLNDKWEFDMWCNGQTGYPVVDAGMRQLKEIGWMHNRARMITASFLVKDLLIDWRWGERFFMRHLIDGDPAANNGGWQWTAGTGTDAAPYFRIFNPVTQGEKFDPYGNYIRQWVPELREVPQKYIHKPWEMPSDVQKRTSCRIGIEYPEPIIDHHYARQRTIEVYRQAKNPE